MERDFRSYQIQKCIKYIFLIKFLYEYFNYVNFSESGEDFEHKDSSDLNYSTCESEKYAHGPYGEPLKTWTNTYDPNPKFSGREREDYTKHDYFGARYYDHNSYRFISVDPVINKSEALTNPQLWNLYSYCRNNPITFLDPDGRDDYSHYAFAAEYHFSKNKMETVADNMMKDTLSGIGAGVVIMAYLAPELIWSASPSIQKYSNKLKSLILRFKDLFRKGYKLSSHASERMIQRGVSSNTLNSVLKIKPFKYFHEGVMKMGHYDPIKKVFVGRVGKTITTVISNVKPNYIENLKK